MASRITTTTPPVLSATTLIGDPVVNAAEENLGELEDLMIDVDNGRIRYAVLSFGGFLGVGNKLFAVPFETLQIDGENERIILDVQKKHLENAPGFNKNNWPDTAQEEWQTEVYEFYGRTPYWR